MKKIILVTATVMICSNAMAMSAYDSKSLTCSAVHDKIAQERSVVFRYPSRQQSGVMMYNRSVSNPIACLGQGAMATVNIPTSDNPACKIKTCNFTTGKGSTKNH